MGYYSNVRFNTTKGGYEEFLAALPDEFKDSRKWGLFDEGGRPEVYEDYGSGVMFGWDSVKWYTDYPASAGGSDPFAEVKAVMAAFDEVLDNGVHPIQYVRVGEDENDVEEMGEYSTDTEDLGCWLGTETRIYLY